jgi:hypothetical protein
MMNNQDTPSLPNQSRTGFTLLEMLISVGLLLMVISIFGQIFSIATRTIRTQRGIGVNDQKARTLDVIVRGDLGNISYKPIPGEEGITPMIGDFIADNSLPLPFNENDAQLAFDGTVGPHPNMQGYVSISENDPYNDTDDVFQFTTQVSIDDEPYYIKSTNLSSWTTAVTGNDHPDLDDNILDNETSVSRQAEIVYFLRNGNLYRRVLAIRAPSFDINNDQQPTRIVPGSPPTTEDLFANLYPTANNFYNDFDFSARYDVASNHAKFNTIADLANPSHRFGHYRGTAQITNPFAPPADIFLNGMAREYIGAGSSARFIGRYTQEETSHASFQYPQRQPATHPMTRPYSAGEITSYERTGRLHLNLSVDPPTPIYPGPRVSEDVLMSNVLSFDIKVWDDAAGQFVDLGYGNLNNLGQLATTNDVNNDDIADGDYAFFQFDKDGESNSAGDPVIGNKHYGDPYSVVIPNVVAPNNNTPAVRHFVFDTWSNDLYIEGIGSNTGKDLPLGTPAASSNSMSSQPPLRPLKYPVYRDGVNVPNISPSYSLPFGAVNRTPWNDTPTADQEEIRRTHAVVWAPGLKIKAGDVVVPTYETEYTDTSDPTAHKLFTHRFIAETHRNIIAFRAKRIIKAVGGGDYVTTASEPFWNQIGGYLATINPTLPPPNDVLSASPITLNYQVSNPSTQFETGTDGTIEWEKILNIQPLKAIKLTIQFRDVGTDQIRQLSLVHAFK